MKKKSRPVARRGWSFSTLGLGHDRDYFLENLSILATSGMAVLEALDAVRTDIRSRRMQRVIGAIREDIESGSPLWRALDRARLFPLLAISLVRVGEESGTLSENLRVVSLQLEKDRVFRAKLRSAMMYPVFVLVLTIVVGVGIAWFILPRLAQVFVQLDVELPLITQVLIFIGLFLGAHGTVVIPAFALACGILSYLFFVREKTKAIGQSMLFAIPGVRRLIQEVELARFGYLLGTLLKAGLPVTHALRSLGEATSVPRYRALALYLEQSIDDGNSFQKSFTAYRHVRRLIPSPIQQLIITGEQSGNLPETLLKIGQTYELKSDTTTKDLTVILEPILLVIVWLGVVGVALAVILPIYGLVGNFQK